MRGLQTHKLFSSWFYLAFIFISSFHTNNQKNFVVGILNGNLITSITAEQIGSIAAIFAGSGQYVCAGAIISSKHIVTAANCFLNVSNGANQYKNRNGFVGVGALTLAGLHTYSIGTVTTHPSYNAVNWQFHPAQLIDLAVITLTNQIVFGGDSEITFVVLASTTSANLVGGAIIQSANTNLLPRTWGFGSISPPDLGDNTNTDLRYNEQSLDDPSYCEWTPNMYYMYNQQDADAKPVGNLPYLAFFDRSTMLCQRVNDLQGPACDGDFGAPIYGYTLDSNNLKNGAYLLGVFSGFAPNGTCGNPVTGIGDTFVNYARFTSMLATGAWIQETTGFLLPDRYFPQPTGTPRPTITPKPTIAPLRASCVGANICGGIAPSRTCFCDLDCVQQNDCCIDVSICPAPRPVDQGLACSLPGICGFEATICWCDSDCLKYGDCCQNYQLYCGSQYGPDSVKTCAGHCGAKANGCWCDKQCATNSDCCPDYTSVCANLGDGDGSCMDSCGAQSGPCFCDLGCTENGDCCPNYQLQCGQSLSCEGYCGKKNTGDSGCWCDSVCLAQGDCCNDFASQCPDNKVPKLYLDALQQKPPSPSG